MNEPTTLQKWAFYIDPETKAKLQALAKQTMRSQAAMLRVLIHEAYNARGAKNVTPALPSTKKTRPVKAIAPTAARS